MLSSANVVLRSLVFVAAIAPAICRPAAALAQAPASQPTSAASQPAKPDIFDPAADAKAQIAAAVRQANRENQRVLLMFGGNWCPWCHKLHELFKSDKDIAKTLLYEYQLVLVDVGRRDKNTDILKTYEVDLKKSGVPFLTVLDGEGKVLTNQETSSFEAGDRHDPKKVTDFLEKWKARPRDAEKALTDALAQAVKDKKVVLLHLGAPWCPWCRKLDDFLADPEIAKIISPDFIDLKIDVDRMTNGKTVAARLRKDDKGGLPWMVLLDAKGKTLATSDGPNGNIGYPAEPEEVRHFMHMLKTAANRVSAEQLGKIEKALKDDAAKLKSAASAPASAPAIVPTTAGTP